MLVFSPAEEREVQLQWRHFLFLRPGTPALIGASLCTRRGAQRDPRARSVVLFSLRSVSLQRSRQDLGSFHVARGRETALCEHPLCRHLTFLHHQYLAFALIHRFNFSPSLLSPPADVGRWLDRKSRIMLRSITLRLRPSSPPILKSIFIITADFFDENRYFEY